MAEDLCCWGRCPQCPPMWLFLELEAVQEASVYAGSRGLPDLATVSEEVWNWLPGALERLYQIHCRGEVG